MPRKPKNEESVDKSLTVRENTLTLEDLSNELASLNLKPNEFGDFLRAVDVALLLRQGQTWDQVAAAVDVPKRTLQWDRWQNLIRKAMTFIISRDVAKVKAAEAQVVNSWTEIVNENIDIIKNGRYDRDKVEASKFLFEAIISRIQDAPDSSDQKKYLDMVNMNPMQQSNQHNPMQVLHVIHHQASDQPRATDVDDDITIEEPNTDSAG